MSKLFNTLEQIRCNEDVKAAGRDSHAQAESNSRRRRRQRVGILLLGLGIIVLGCLLLPGGTRLIPEGLVSGQVISSGTSSGQPERAAEAVNPVPSDRVPQQTVEQGLTVGSEQEFIDLVNKGTAYIEEGNFWQALYLLDKAQQLQPHRLEPLLNSVVALVDLGLNELAVDYLKKAEAKDPEHPLLKKNKILLSRAGIIDRTH